MSLGSRRENIRREHVIEVLGQINEDYRKHCSIVLARVQQMLSDNLGYTIVNVENIIGRESVEEVKTSTVQEYFLTNELRNPILLRILSQTNNDAAYTAFVFIVCIAIYTSPQKRAPVRDILTHVRQIDPRFAESLTAGRNAEKSVVVAELGEDFLGLLQKMRKVRTVRAMRVTLCCSFVAQCTGT